MTRAMHSDVGATHAFYTAIAWLTAEGIAGGYADGTFRSGAKVSRQATAAFLWRDAGEPAAPAFPECPFVDVCAGHPFLDAITWLSFEGIASGFDDGTFRPVSPVSRQAMASFLLRDEYRRQWAEVDGALSAEHGAPRGLAPRPDSCEGTRSGGRILVHPALCR
jgi:hypothetical protein